jgi:hypothetical protein
MVIHMGIAGATSTPELILEEGEAKMLSEPLARMAEDAGFVVDPKIANALALLGACGMVYGPRMVNIRNRRKEEKANAKPKREGNVVSLRPAPVFSDPFPAPDPNINQPVAPPPPLAPELDAANAFRFTPPEG